MNIIKTNLDIYNLGENLNKVFQEENRCFPAKLYFYILKNTNVLNTIIKEIDNSREYIVKKYGNLQEDGRYLIGQENIELANKELEELGKIEQEINISMIKLSDLEGLEFTPAQMQALMFMIEE